MTRQERAERTRESILDAAAEEFDAHGYAGARLDRIVERTQLTKGAVYFHFRSKQELAETLVSERREYLPEVVASVSARGLAGIPAAVEVTRRLGEAFAGDVRMRAALKLSPAEIATVVDGDPQAGWTGVVEGYLRQAVDAGELAPGVDAGDLAAVAVRAFFGALLIADENNKLEAFATDIERLWAVLGPQRPGL